MEALSRLSYATWISNLARGGNRIESSRRVSLVSVYCACRSASKRVRLGRDEGMCCTASTVLGTLRLTRWLIAGSLYFFIFLSLCL